MDVFESTQQIPYKGKTFPVTLLRTEQPTFVVIFAAGRGGSPLRHFPLLRKIAESGCTVIAPHFDLLPRPTATKEELEIRLEQLELVMDQYSTLGGSLIGIGHSIGATLLLTLAGGSAITSAAQPLSSGPDRKFDKLVLLAPSVDFFLHPGGPGPVGAEVYVRTGVRDAVTPAAKTILFHDILREHVKTTLVLDKEAGHFSYMDELPPRIEDTQPDRRSFLSEIADDIAQFVTPVA